MRTANGLCDKRSNQASEEQGGEGACPFQSSQLRAEFWITGERSYRANRGRSGVVGRIASSLPEINLGESSAKDA